MVIFEGEMMKSGRVGGEVEGGVEISIPPNRIYF
jgi:hypothetical protein